MYFVVSKCGQALIIIKTKIYYTRNRNNRIDSKNRMGTRGLNNA